MEVVGCMVYFMGLIFYGEFFMCLLIVDLFVNFLEMGSLDKVILEVMVMELLVVMLNMFG